MSEEELKKNVLESLNKREHVNFEAYLRQLIRRKYDVTKFYDAQLDTLFTITANQLDNEGCKVLIDVALSEDIHRADKSDDSSSSINAAAAASELSDKKTKLKRRAILKDWLDTP